MGQAQPGPATAAPTTHAPTAAPTTHAPTAAPTTKATAPPATTSAPKPKGTTFEDITKRLSQDPRLQNLTQQVAKIVVEINNIEKVFEMDTITRDIGKLNSVLTQVKTERQKTTLLLSEIHSEIASVPFRSFLFRLLQESLRIQTEKYDKLLKWIGLEILGDLSDVSRFESYYYSETVSIAQELLVSRFLNMLLDAYEADKILNEAFTKDPLHGKLEPAAKQQVDKYLKDMITNAQSAKQEMTKDYYEELEKIRLDNRELNLLQRLEAEMYIDSLNYAINFVQKYDEMFLRLN